MENPNVSIKISYTIQHTPCDSYSAINVICINKSIKLWNNQKLVILSILHKPVASVGKSQNFTRDLM